MESTLLIFLDGIGIGEEDYEFNPFFKYGFKTFENIFNQIPSTANSFFKKDNIFLWGTDANLGIEGLPQSGTGQTSIFTGINAPSIIGQHFGPYPYSTLLPTLKQKNIFKEFLNRNKKVFFANAYPKIFFDYVNSGRRRLSVTSLSCLYSEVKLQSVTALRKGKALSAEIDNSRWVNKLGYNLPIIKPQTAANRLIKIASENNFTLFEYFLSDHLGHWREREHFNRIFKTLDDFLFEILTKLPKEITLLICSDHGNLEDLSTKMHTRNPALTISAGKYSHKLYERIQSLDQIKDAILELYQ